MDTKRNIKLDAAEPLRYDLPRERIEWEDSLPWLALLGWAAFILTLNAVAGGAA